jgi:hypothetical protein
MSNSAMNLPAEVEFHKDIRLLIYRPSGVIDDAAVKKLYPFSKTSKPSCRHRSISVMQCISKLGGESEKLVTAYDAPSSHAASPVKRLTNNNKNQQNQNL